MMDLTDGNIEQYNLLGAYSLLNKFESAHPSQYGTLLNEQEKENLDFFVSLHKHGIAAYVRVEPTPVEILSIQGQRKRQKLEVKKWHIKFIQWKNTIVDTYDFNAQVGFKLPNPDYESKESYAIMPDRKLINHGELTHKYLVQFVDNGLAMEYKVNGTWDEEHEEIRGDAVIDISNLS